MQMRTIGVIGTGRNVGVTHCSITMAGYTCAVLRHKTCILEWNGHRDFERLREICLKETRLKEKTQMAFCILDVDYYAEAGTEALLLCKTKGYEDVIVDCGTAVGGGLDQFLRCDRQFVIGSLSEWQVRAFLEFSGKWKRANVSWKTLTVFGSEESRKQMEKKLGVSIRRIPVSEDAFVITGEMMKFYQTILE